MSQSRIRSKRAVRVVAMSLAFGILLCAPLAAKELPPISARCCLPLNWRRCCKKPMTRRRRARLPRHSQVVPRGPNATIKTTVIEQEKAFPVRSFSLSMWTHRPAVAKDNFNKLTTFFGPSTPLPGIGDAAYRDSGYAVHVVKGNVRYYINMIPIELPRKRKATERPRRVGSRATLTGPGHGV